MLQSIAAVEYICDVPMRSDVKMEIFVSRFVSIEPTACTAYRILQCLDQDQRFCRMMTAEEELLAIT